MARTLVYKILGADEWRAARADGAVAPSAIDRKDRFIHLSGEDQVLETARLHFAGRTDLVAVEFDADALGPSLKWEASRGGALFPHLYGALFAALAIGARHLLPLEGASGYRFGPNA